MDINKFLKEITADPKKGILYIVLGILIIVVLHQLYWTIVPSEDVKRMKETTDELERIINKNKN